MMNPFSAPVYLLPPLILFVAGLVLLSVVLRGTRGNFTGRILSFLLLSIALGGFAIFGMRSSPDVEQALIWDRISFVAAFAVFVFYYHFTLAYTNIEGRRIILYAAYLLLVIAAAAAPTGLLVERMRLEDYGYAPVSGPLTLALVAAGIFLVGDGIHNLIKRYKSTALYEERNRLLYLTIMAPLLLIGACLDVFSSLPPVGLWAALLFCIICTIAILKYHLLDIRVVVRKSLVYLFVSLVIAIPYVGMLYLLHFIFGPTLEPWWVHAIIILLLAILLRPLYSWAQNFVDRLFYRDRYDYLKALQQFSQKAQSVINLKELSSTLTQLVSGALRTSSVCLLLPSESNSDLVVVSSAGLGNPPSGVALRSRSPLVKWLKLKQRILSSEEFDIVPQLQSLSLREKNNLEQMGAKLYVPIQPAVGQISGILVLGQKLSQQPYSSEDRRLLTALGSQMAIALENARLYNESRLEVKERKLAEEALEHQKAYFQQLFDNSPDAIVLVDTADRIVDVNKGFETLFGYRANEIKGQPINDVIVPEDRIEEASALSQAGFNSEVIRLETVRKCKDDSLINVAIVGYPIRLGNETVGGCVIYSDITERKRVEDREKELQQELYESGRLAAIGELAAGVAHEINNPLTAILGFSQRVLKKSRNKSLARDLERISGETLRAARIVQNLLTFARRRKPEKEDCDANDILQRALELRAYELKTSNIKVVADLTPRLPKVRADSHQIQEVFLNVVLNAEQAMVEAHQGGTLTIKTCKNKGYVQIMFSDDGPGIANENLHRIFLPFFSTRADKGGTGLGLSICHGIITEHGGKIRAKSRLGEGTTFIVELPAATGKTSKGKTAEKKPARKADGYHRPISGS
jgi:PAS domain S-box-containing protein